MELHAHSCEPWTQEEAFRFCHLVEQIAPEFGAHVALTGGLLYKDGPRKDCDIVLYRIRQREVVDFDGLWAALKPHGVEFVADYGWCKKLKYEGKPVDAFDPDEDAWENIPEGTSGHTA